MDAEDRVGKSMSRRKRLRDADLYRRKRSEVAVGSSDVRAKAFGGLDEAVESRIRADEDKVFRRR